MQNISDNNRRKLWVILANKFENEILSKNVNHQIIKNKFKISKVRTVEEIKFVIINILPNKHPNQPNKNKIH